MDLCISPEWEALKQRLLEDSAWRVLMVAGPVNTGKTTLATWLATQLNAKQRTLYLDADPGQSLLGPPTTLALGELPLDPERWLRLRFVGHISPEGHLLQMMGGLCRLIEAARWHRAERLIVDLPGHIPGEVGRELFFQVLDVVQPDYVVVLQREAELEPVLQCFRRSRRPRIVRLAIPEAVRERDRLERSDYRRERFRRYFAGARLWRLSVQARGLHGMVPALDNPEAIRHRLVALCDRYGFARVLGIVARYDADLACLYCWAPPFRAREIATIQFGRFRLNPTEVALPVRRRRPPTGDVSLRTDAVEE